MITTIPFSGFYNSMHDSELDREIESIISDDSGNAFSQTINNEIWDAVNWCDAHNQYAKEYAEYFAHWFKGEFGVNLTWESISSPREYNFQTDRIFCKITHKDAATLYKKVKREHLKQRAIERFTSRSGFISFYSPDVKTWGPVRTWDHNQLGTLIEAAVMQAKQYPEQDIEETILEQISGNGVASNCIYNALTDKGKRLVRICDYLRDRSNRKYRTRKTN